MLLYVDAIVVAHDEMIVVQDVMIVMVAVTEDRDLLKGETNQKMILNHVHQIEMAKARITTNQIAMIRPMQRKRP